MANIWQDKRTYVDENKFIPAKMHQGHPRVHSIKKKQIFGELKNVMHNQFGVTPLKGDLDANKGVKCYDGGLANKKVCIPNKAENAKVAMDPLELFDLMDFPKTCCTSSCAKSNEEIWANFNGIDEVALLRAIEKIRNGNPLLDFDEKSGGDMEEFYEDEEDFTDLLKESAKPVLYLEDYDNGDFSSCSAELPKLDFFNDIILHC